MRDPAWAAWESAGARLELAAAESGGRVATVTLCRPEQRNAQTPATWRALAEIGRHLPGDVRVVVLRGEGKSFSAGLDRAMLSPGGVPGFPTFVEMAAMPPGGGEDVIAGYQEAFTWWSRTDLISVAAVQGHAVGAGFQLALGCDLRVLADDALLSMKEPALGLVPDLGGTKPLVELVGFSRALEICATARWVTADEAAALGLATTVVPRSELDAAVRDLVEALLAAPRDAVVETKALLRGSTNRSKGEQLVAEREAQMRRIRDLAALLQG